MLSLRQKGSALITEQEAATARLMMRVVSYAETVQLVSPSTEAGIDHQDFEAALAALASQGLVRRVPPTTSLTDLEEIAARACEAIEASPSPGVEWNLAEVLGDRLADLVGVSVSSMTRYRTGQRVTPDDVALRLHVIAQVVADLSGSYNAYGIRRWFDRPRSPLGGQTPGGVLRGAWDPEDEQVVTVRELASALTV